MPTYIYTAIAKTGEKVKGTEIAENERQLATISDNKFVKRVQLSVL